MSVGNRSLVDEFRELVERSRRVQRPPTAYVTVQVERPPVQTYPLSYDVLLTVPVIVLGRDPPFIGHYLFHKVEIINGRPYWRISVGFYEVWAEVLDRSGRPVAYYPYMVNGLPSLGAYVAHQVAKDIDGLVNLRIVGLYEPIDEVLVPEDAIWWLDKVLDGRFRLLICDPAGVLKHGDYDLVRNVYVLQDMLTRYGQSLHSLDREYQLLHITATLQSVELRKYRQLLDEVQANLIQLVGTVRRLQGEIETLKAELEYWQKLALIRRDIASSMTSRVAELEQQIQYMMEICSRLMETVTKGLAQSVIETEQMLVQQVQQVRQGQTGQTALTTPTAPTGPTSRGYA